MMNTNYREQLNMPRLKNLLGVNSLNNDLDIRQRKAINNFKYCANDQWQYVNSWYDCRDEQARQLMMNPRELFNIIYTEALTNVYHDGAIYFGRAAEAHVKHIRFCGKEFLEKIAFYFTAKLLEESVPEVEGTEEDAARVAADLKALKSELNIA